MSVIDILFRVDEICKKYDKYDIEKQRDLNAYGDDAFAHLYSSLEAEIEAAFHKSEIASMETNRASAVAMNAEVRRTKARLMNEVPKLRKLAVKKQFQMVPQLQPNKLEGGELQHPIRISSSTHQVEILTVIFSNKLKNQDQGLDFISDGLGTLKNLAEDMNEEMDRQVPLVDEIETKADKVTSDMKNTNIRLKKSLNQLRSSRNFCIDIILYFELN
ncbi:syntaxin-71 [Quercus suber]|uniref:Syntaxin-71 n=1 Tax=Quercus suber TaxID=58331 RepID=A0AAW0JGA1_QUESU